MNELKIFQFTLPQQHTMGLLWQDNETIGQVIIVAENEDAARNLGRNRIISCACDSIPNVNPPEPYDIWKNRETVPCVEITDPSIIKDRVKIVSPKCIAH